MRIPTRENPLVLIAVDIGGKKHKGIGPDENLSCPHSRSRDQHSAGWHPREGRWTVTPARERNLTAVTQEKTFIIRMFVLQILLDFFSFFPPSVVVVNFISSMKSNSTFKLFFSFLKHIFYCCYKPLVLHWAFAVFLFLLFFLLLIFKPIVIFSTVIPLLAFPTVLSPLQLIFNAYKSSLSTSI